jgi:hypothetical protein
MGKSSTITHFFKRNNLNDLEATTSDATLPTTNANIPIPENIKIPIPENVDIHIPENVDIPIQENPHPKFQKIDTYFVFFSFD